MSAFHKVKQHRLHHEGTATLFWGGVALVAILFLSYWLFFDCCRLAFWTVAFFFGSLYGVVVNFFRCPIRVYCGETDHVVVAPADGKVVVIEEVEENEYFKDRRLMVSIFMSVVNVHANWVPVDGIVKMVRHHDGAFHKAWLPKASTENERSTVVITTPDGEDILVRQVAGAMARRIVTYLKEGEECSIDNHLGFIKFGSRVDVYLPLGTQVKVKMGQITIGNQTVLAELPRKQA